MYLKENIDFKGGNLSYYDFNADPSIPFENQIYDIKEDLAQVVYGNYLVDVGWSPDCNVNGHFVLRIIKDYDWQTPICIKETRSFSRLKQYFQECIDLAASLANNDQKLPNLTQQSVSSIKYENFSFDRSEFKDFFDEESYSDIESGAFYYSIKLEHGFEFEINILAIDNFVSLTLRHDTDTFSGTIFDIGFDEIVKIKLNKREDLDYVGLDLYKKAQEPSSNGKAPKPSLSITIKPSVSITLGV